MSILKRPDSVAWWFYDWANSAFATTVMAGFFPVYFNQFWRQGVSDAETTFSLGLANGLAGLIVALLAPVLGAIADQMGIRKGFLLFFTTLGIIMTGSLHWVAQGEWMLALMTYGLAVVGFSSSIVFYDAMLLLVSRESEYDRISAIGYALGYLGGGLLFTLNVIMTLYPESFGLSGPGEAVSISFVLVAIWWAVFSIPIFLFVREPKGRRLSQGGLLAGVRQLVDTFHKVRQLKITFIFLLAYWCYIDGVDTIVRMAVDYGMSIGFNHTDLLTALLVTQFVGFPAAVVFGYLGEKYGPKTGILIAIGVYLVVILWAYRMQAVWEFYLLAVVIGLVQGGIQALSRSLYARLIPPHQATEFYGFYNMVGKFSVVVGPMLMGWVGVLTGDARTAMLSVAVLFVIGGLLLARLDITAGQHAAAKVQFEPNGNS